MTKKFAVAIRKGGAGKTALTINTARALSIRGYSVLVIDMDGQGHTTKGIGAGNFFNEGNNSIYHLIISKEGNIEDYIIEHPKEDFHFIPADRKIDDLAFELSRARNGENRLANALTAYQDHYDFVFIDCPPSDNLVTDSALLACRRVIMPLAMSQECVDALTLSFNHMEDVSEDYGVDIQLSAVVPNLVRGTQLAREILSGLDQNMREFVSPAYIPDREVLKKAWKKGQSIFNYEALNANDRNAQKILQDAYLQLADYLV